jgi:hypothetical protein
MKRRSRRILLVLVPILGGIAALAAGWHLRERTTAHYTDADTIHRPADDARVRDVLWRQAEPLDAAVNSADDEYEPRPTADGTTLFLVRGRAGADADLYLSRRTPEGWSAPEPIAALNTDADELGPEPAENGAVLYFYSNRAGGHGGYDLWVTRRTDDGWEAPRNLGPDVNSEFNEYGPAVTPDGEQLYFASNRPQPGDGEIREAGAWPATVREEIYQRHYDLYVSPFTERGPGRARPLVALNSPYNDGAPAVSPVGDFLYFSSDRPGGHGGFDLYRTRRLRGEYVTPENLGAAVNSPANELDPGVHLGGFGLHFSSDRHQAGADGETPRRDYDLYQTTSREVFVETETWRASIDWAELLPALIWLLLTILALLLMWLLARLLRSDRFGALSLLSRCLVASLLTHAAVLFLLAFWGVGSSLSTWVREGAGLQVALVSPSVGSGIAAQIRGELTEMEVNPTVAEHAPARVELPDAPPVDATALLAVERAELPDDEAPRPLAAPDDAPARPLEPDEPSRATPASVADAVQVELPADPDRRAREEAAAAPPAPDTGPEPPRRAVARTETPTPSATVDVTVPPSELAAAVASRSLAPDARDAATAPRSTALLPEPAPAVPPLAPRETPIDASLPPAPDAEADVEADNERTVAAPTSDLAPPPPPSIPRPAAPTPSPVALPPLETADDGARESLALAAEDVATESGAPGLVPRAPAPTPAPAPEMPAPETLDIAALPDHTGRTSTEATLTVSGPRPAPRTTPVRDPAPEPAPAPTAPFVDTAPDAPPATFSPRPLASATDATTPDAPTRAPRPVEVGVVPPPPITAVDVRLDLPTVSEAQPEERPPEPATALMPRPDVPALDRATVPHEVVPPAAPDASPLADLPPFRPESAPAADASPFRFGVPTPPVPTLSVDVPTVRPRLAVPEPVALDVEVPLEAEQPPDPQPQRAEEVRQELVEEMGGSEETEEAVARALDWLRRHQSDDGRWDSEDFDDACGACGGDARVDVDIALTGLSLLCFLGADHTHVRDGPYRDVVRAGVRWLVDRHMENGDLLGRESMYSHGIATIALAEAYGMTGDPQLAPLVEDAVAFIIEARNRRDGGWRYAPGQPGDTSVLGWQVMAMSAARRAGVEVDPDGLDGAVDWLDRVRSDRHPGRFAYQPNRKATPAMTAEGMFTRQLLGQPPHAPGMAEAAEYLLRHPPAWERGTSTYYLYYATLALFQHQGDAWVAWNEQVKETLLAHQETEGELAGSWEPNDQWARTGGRVYQTAVCTLTLEVYYRYLPLYMRGTP